MIELYVVDKLLLEMTRLVVLTEGEPTCKQSDRGHTCIDELKEKAHTRNRTLMSAIGD